MMDPFELESHLIETHALDAVTVESMDSDELRRAHDTQHRHHQDHTHEVRDP